MTSQPRVRSTSFVQFDKKVEHVSLITTTPVNMPKTTAKKRTTNKRGSATNEACTSELREQVKMDIIRNGYVQNDCKK